MRNFLKRFNLFIIISLLIIFFSFSLNLHAEDEENVILYNFTRFYEYTSQEIKLDDLTFSYNGTTLSYDDFEITYPEDCTSVGTKEVTIKYIGDETYTFSGGTEEDTTYYYILDKYIQLSNYGISDGMTAELRDGVASPFSALLEDYDEYLSIDNATLSRADSTTSTITFKDSTKRVVVDYYDSYDSYYYIDSGSSASFTINWNAKYIFTENDERLDVTDLDNIGYTIGYGKELSWNGNVNFSDTIAKDNYSVEFYIPELYGNDSTVSISGEEANGTVYDVILHIVFDSDRYSGYVNKTIKLCPSIETSEVELLDGATQDGENIVFQYGLKTPPFNLTMDINSEIKTLVYGTDFTVHPSDLFHTVDNSYNLTLTGIGNYAGTSDVRCMLTPKSLNDESITYIAEENAYYSGSDTHLVIEIHDTNDYYDGLYTISSSDYDVTYEFDTDNNTGVATVTGIGNYKDSFTIDFILANRDNSRLSWDIKWEAYYDDYDAMFYTAEQRIPSAIFKYDDEILTEGIDYELSLSGWELEEILNLNYKLKGNYYGGNSIPFKLAPIMVEGAVDYVILEGTEATQNLIIKDINGNLLEEDTDYTISYEDNTGYGTAKYTITLLDNEETIKGTFRVISKVITKDDSLLKIVGLDNGDYSLDVSDNYSPDPWIYYGGNTDEYKLTKDTDYTITTVLKDSTGNVLIYGSLPGITSDQANGNVYYATTTITFKGKYYGTLVYDSLFVPRIDNATILPKDDARSETGYLYYEYTGSNIVPDFDVIFEVNGEEVTLTKGIDYEIVDMPSEMKNVDGSYSFYINGIGNYGGSIYVMVEIQSLDSSYVDFEYEEYGLYTGGDVKPTVVLKDKYNNPLIEGEDYSIECEYENLDSDGYGVVNYTISFMGNYGGDPKTSEFYVVDHAVNLTEYGLLNINNDFATDRICAVIVDGHASVKSYFDKLLEDYPGYFTITNMEADVEEPTYISSIFTPSDKVYAYFVVETDDGEDNFRLSDSMSFEWYACLAEIKIDDPLLEINNYDSNYYFGSRTSISANPEIKYNEELLTPDDYETETVIKDKEGNVHYYNEETSGISDEDADGSIYTAYVTVRFKGRYFGTVNYTFGVYPSIENLTLLPINTTRKEVNTLYYEYTGETIVPSFNLGLMTSDDEKILLVEGTDFELMEGYSLDKKDAGTYQVLYQGIGNYRGSFYLTYEIEPKYLSNESIKVSTTNNSYVDKTTYQNYYEIEFYDQELDYYLSNDTDYIIEDYYDDDMNLVHLGISGRGNYTGTINKSLSVASYRLDDGTIEVIYDVADKNQMYFTGTDAKPKIVIKNANGNTLVEGTDYEVKFTGDFTKYGETIVYQIDGLADFYGRIIDEYVLESESISEIKFAYSGKTTLKTLINNSFYKDIIEECDDIEVDFSSIGKEDIVVNAKVKKGYIINYNNSYYLEGNISVWIFTEDNLVGDIVSDAAEEIINSATESATFDLNSINFEDLTGLSKEELIKAKEFYNNLEKYVIDNEIDVLVNNHIAELGYDDSVDAETIAVLLKNYLDTYATNVGYTNFESQVDDAINAVTVEEEKDLAKEELSAFIHRHNKAVTIEKLHQVVAEQQDELDSVYYEKYTEDETRNEYLADVTSKVHEIKNVTILIVKHTQSQAIANNSIEDYYNELKESGKYNEAQLQLLKEVFDEMQEKVEAVLASDNVDDQLLVQEELNKIVQEAIEKLSGIEISSISTDTDSDNQVTVEASLGMNGKTSLSVEKAPLNVSIAISRAISKNKVEGTSEDAILLIKNKDVKDAFDIELDVDGERVEEFKGVYKVKILLTDELKSFNNLQIVYLAEDGSLEVCDTYIEGDYLVFTTTHFSIYYLLGDKVVDFAPIIKILLATIAALIIVIVVLILRIKNKKINEMGVAFSCVLVPLSALISVNVLVVCIALGIIASILLIVAVLLAIKDYKIDRRLSDEE